MEISGSIETYIANDPYKNSPITYYEKNVGRQNFRIDLQSFDRGLVQRIAYQVGTSVQAQVHLNTASYRGQPRGQQLEDKKVAGAVLQGLYESLITGTIFEVQYSARRA